MAPFLHSRSAIIERGWRTASAGYAHFLATNWGRRLVVRPKMKRLNGQPGFELPASRNAARDRFWEILSRRASSRETSGLSHTLPYLLSSPENWSNEGT